ncbi:MAG TPA: hypothetical protein PL193_07570 [Xanthobacteraceae bacterium]|nr:hypothetical protein [Xanthobacteraceae bacterium]
MKPVKAADLAGALPIVAEFRRTIFSDERDIRPFTPGLSIAEIVDRFPVPREFSTHGAVFLKRHAKDPGIEVARAFWHLVRPKPGTVLFIAVAPQGGSGKQMFALVAAIALVALTAWIGGGGLAFLSPLLGAGTTGAKIASAAFAVAGAAAMAAMSKPVVGAQADAEQKTFGQAGISQNVLSINQPLPAVLGALRVSPPQLMRPYTTIENTDQFVHGVVGLSGPVDINAIKVNETAVEDLPAGQFTFEVREGHADDTELTLIRNSAFEESINLEMSRHRLDKDNITLIEPHAASYPQPHIFRSARNADKFRITLNFPQGLSRFDNGDAVLLPLRLEMRAVGESTWRKLPEMHFEASVRSAFRQEIVFQFGGDENALRQATASVTSLWKRLYAKNAEWESDFYFRASAAPLDLSTLHVFAAADQLLIYLSPAAFPRGQYEFRMQRGFTQNAGDEHSAVTYTGGLFTYRTLSGGKQQIPNQSVYAGSIAIQSYTTFRNEYPFAARGVAMVAFKAKNLQINSISFDAAPIVPVWNGSNWNDREPSSNPAALTRWVLTGSLNARPLDPALSQGMEDWFEYCDLNGLSCNALITDGSVERAANLAANCGDAIMRDSDKWGPVIDRDRSAEPAKQAFSAHNMTAPLIMRKLFSRIADGIYPTFVDAQRDYATRTLDLPVYADGVDASHNPLMEGASYDGLTFEALVRRRATRDLRRARYRAVSYSWGCNQEQLIAKKGDIVALAHDILAETYGMGRVRSFQKDNAGNLLRVTLNTAIADIPVTSPNDFFAVSDMTKLSDVFTLGSVHLGMQIRLADGGIGLIPVSSVEGATLIVDQGVGGFPAPNHLRAGCLAQVGWRERVSRRVIIANIVPRKGYDAQIEAVDEAPQIHAGL